MRKELDKLIELGIKLPYIYFQLKPIKNWKKLKN